MLKGEGEEVWAAVGREAAYRGIDEGQEGRDGKGMRWRGEGDVQPRGRGDILRGGRLETKGWLPQTGKIPPTVCPNLSPSPAHSG